MKPRLEELTTWPLWQCLKPEDLVKLIQLQWELYGTKLELLEKTPLSEIESLEEIEQLMRQKPHYPKGARWRG